METGWNVGKLEGKLEGAASKVIEIVIKKYKKGCSVKETADMLEEPQTLIKQIYDVIGQCAPDYNVEAIYKILLPSIRADHPQIIHVMLHTFFVPPLIPASLRA